MKHLVDNGADVNAMDNDGWTPLILAARYKTLEMVKYLVDNGVNVNATKNDGWTPLMFAAKYGTFEMVNYLVEYGADVNAKNDDGWDVLQIARSNERLEIVQYLTTPRSKSNGGISFFSGFSVLFRQSFHSTCCIIILISRTVSISFIHS